MLALVAYPASAQARASSSCRKASRARGSHVLVRDGAAVVFARGSGRVFGCTFAGGRVRRLDTFDTSNGYQYKLAGRFAAYTYSGSAIGDETNKLGVYDLRTGKLRAIAKLDPHGEGAGREIETSTFVSVFLVAPDGSLAWIEKVRHATGSNPLSQPTFGPDSEVRAAAGAPPRERILDSGNIGPRSLRLLAGGRQLSWTKDGASKTVAFP